MITTDIAKAVQSLLNDEIIGVPTETVYGLAGNAYSENAIKKIFSLKNRPLYNPLIVHIKSTTFLTKVASEILPLLDLRMDCLFCIDMALLQ